MQYQRTKASAGITKMSEKMIKESRLGYLRYLACSQIQGLLEAASPSLASKLGEKCKGVSIQLLDALLLQHVRARLQRNFAGQFWPRDRHKRIHAAKVTLQKYHEIPRVCVLLGRVLQTVKKSV